MKKLSFFVIALFFYSTLIAQEKEVHVSLETQGIVTTNDAVPFWLRSNQYGSVPLPGGSGSLIARIRKDYDTTKTFSWAASFEGRGNLGRTGQFILVEGLVKARAGIFELKAGRSKDVVGLADSTLSSGSFAVSGNALGVPKIGIGIPDYYSIPVWGKLFAVKAGLYNGYLGNVDAVYKNKPINFNSYYLENYFYFRIGKPAWRFKIDVGYNHEVQWGAEKQAYSTFFNLNSIDAYWYVLTGKAYRGGSKVGNHLGSVDIGAEYRFDSFNLSLYRQNLYDIGALSHLANIADGLNGITIANTLPNSGSFHWKKFLFELLYTANQAGGLGSKRTSSGAENYYNNDVYTEGWAYNNIGLGTPFITSRNDARGDLARASNQFFINNRVLALHTAAQFYMFNWLYTYKLSYSQNQGTFATGTELYRGVDGAIRTPGKYGTFKKVHQYSGYIEGLRPLKNGYNVGYNIGYDRGGLLYNSFGIILKASKTFL
ncbi:capsule assembly Wzi family protein [Mucilaginibacter dorajii]|uniref:Capsule assembly Wzi family protein n=1 Tax=Mucilaginibacter dorajii TaxID=692994 RepID=A0ABP7PKY4_9SPHI|nr:capsule assembly Wzi family protein [Mucilaginibacter dorajii]MCS3733626.1 hypothetical protein [Mucilaginibacter dorajii]